MASSREYYAAADVRLPGIPPLHMTIAFMGPRPCEDWKVISNKLADIDLPFEIQFTEVTKFYGDLEVVLVKCSDASVEDAIRAFHAKYVNLGHVSEDHLKLHVTSKGYAEDLLAMRFCNVNQLYVRALGSPKDTYVVRLTK